MSTKYTLVESARVTADHPRGYGRMDAIRYIGRNRTYFDRWVKQGLIPFIVLPGSRTKTFLKEDLDAFLDSQKKRRMAASESPLLSLKGASL